MNCSTFHSTLMHPEGFPEIEPTTLHLQPSARIVDVREPRELVGDLPPIPGAENVPLGKLAHAASSWEPDEPLVLVCRSGSRSGLAVQALRRMGFKCAVNMRGGMLGYRALLGTR